MVHWKKRETRFELATACLEGRNSTTELLPHNRGARTSNRGPPGPKPGTLPTAPHPADVLNYNTLLVTCQVLFSEEIGFMRSKKEGKETRFLVSGRIGF